MAEKEIELLENVELRIALANKNEQFEKCLNVFLCPVLLKLGSPHDNVRQKVMSICNHVSKRIKSNIDIKLPTEKLLELFTSDNSSNFVSNFSLLFLEIAFNRTTEDEKVALIPKLIQNISKRNSPQKIQIFQIFLKTIECFNKRLIDFSKQENKDIFNFTEHPNDLKFILEKFADILLYIPSAPDKPPVVSPGLSTNSMNFVSNNGKAAWIKGNELASTKVNVVRFAMSEFIPNNIMPINRFIVFIIASVDSNYEVANLGDSALKKIRNPNLEKQDVINELYKLYQGTQSNKVKEVDIRKPASNNLKLKIMNYLEKSICAANTSPNFIQVCFDCLYGADTNVKLRKSGMIFTQWIARMTDEKILSTVGSVLLTGFNKYIDEHKFEKGLDQEGLLCYAYETVGLLSERLPELILKDISIIEKLFDLLPKESSSVKPSVKNCLVSICDSISKVEKSDIINNFLEGILFNNIAKTEYYTTYCEIKFCTTLFPFSHALSRYLCFIGAGNSRLEIRELAKSGLSFVNNQDQLPSFKEVLDLINTQILSKIKRNEFNIPYEGQRITEIIPYINAESYCAMLEFLRSLIIVKADPKVQINELGKVTEETIMTKETSNKIKALLKTYWNETHNYSNKNESPINLYFALLEILLNVDLGNQMVHAISSACLFELVCFSPSELLANYHNKISWIESFVYSLKMETRNSMSHILGIVATENADKNNVTVVNLLKKFLNILTSKDDQRKMSVEYQHGSIMGIGYLLGKLQLRYPTSFRNILKIDDMDNFYESLVNTVISYLDIKNQVINIGACNSLSEICKYSINPLTLKDSDTNNETAKNLLEKLVKIFNDTKDTKIHENIVMTLAFLALGTPSLVNEVLENFFTIAEKMSKNVELLFTLGEAISIVIGGWNSTLMDKFIDISDVQFPIEGHSRQDDKIVETFLDKCLNDMLKGGRPNRCKIVCIWLLCIVKYTSKLPFIQDKLPDIHATFSYLLADRDEFTQEVASKGIGLVYDLGNDKVKQDLVGSLVNTLSEGRKMEKVNENTQIFNNLGTTPDGSQLSTYKDLLGLASDMNQPDLVYKFMNLASHNAIWNSRRGASLGFSVIMSQARNDLLPHLPTLIPKLYRFQFDPNVKVNTAMKQVWKSLVANPKEAVDKYFDVIIVELINGLGDRMWRTRESSCSALADLLHGRKISQLEKYLEDLWNMTFRVLDDVKESVRVAAFSACKVLTKITVSNCDPSVVSPENGKKTMEIIIPFLLKKGLPSPAEEVRLFALNTVFKLCKTSGVLLKPHITNIISILLESLSSLEPQAINYLSFHTDSTQQLDNLRLSATKSSPLIEAVENCIEYIDDDVMKTLAPELCTLIRKSVGFPSKAGTARFVVSLTLRKPLIVKPYADNILKALASTQSDRNMTIRKLYSSSIGYVAHISSYQALSKFIKKVTKQYIENDDEETRSMAAVVLKEISNHASDQIKDNCLKIVLPLAIFGSCDPDENINKIWRDVWDDNTAGSIGAMKLYMDEITTFINDNLVSNSWRVKKQAACTLIEVTKTIDSYIEKKLDVLMPTLINGLSGRIWDGKESMLQAFAVVTIACKNSPLLNEESSWRAEAIKILLREANKKNKKYKRNSIYWMGEVFKELNINKFEEVCDILVPFIGGWPDEVDENKMEEDSDDEDDPTEKPLKLLVTSAIYKCIGTCFTKEIAIQGNYNKKLAELFSSGLKNYPWNVRVAILEAITQYLKKIEETDKLNVLLTSSDVNTLSQGLFTCMEDGKYAIVREKAVTVLKQLITDVKDNSTILTNELKEFLNTKITSYINNEGLVSPRENAQEIKKLLQ